MLKKPFYAALASSLLFTSTSLADGGNAGVSSSTSISKPTPSASGFQTSITRGYHSKYIWRGLDLENDMTDMCIGTRGSYAGLELSAGAWHARILDQLSNLPKNRTDLYAEAAKDLGFAKLSVGYIFSHFSDSSSSLEDTQEVYFGLHREIAGFTTGITYYWDIETDNQGYLELDIEKNFTCPFTKLNFDASVTAGYLVEEGALSHLTSMLSMPFQLPYGIKATPYVSYVVELDDLERYAGTSQQNEFVGGISLKYTF